MGPFPRKMKLRAIQIDYGLAGRWSVVSLESEASWAAVREQLLGEFYQRFGLIHLGDGTNTIRWNEYTWRGLRDIMKFEYDPDFAGQDPAGPSGA